MGVDGIIDGRVEVGGIYICHGQAGVVGVLADGEGVEACVDEVGEASITERVQLHFLGYAGGLSHAVP